MSSTDDEQLGRLCEVLNAHHVVYVIFGSFAGRLQGADLHTVDVDVVPDRSEYNLQRLCDALNSLSPGGESTTSLRDCGSTAEGSNPATSWDRRSLSGWSPQRG